MFQKMLLFFTGLLMVFASAAQNEELLVQGVAPKNFLNHTVAAKESLFSVGRLYNVSPKEVAAFNGMPADKGIAVGQKLKIPLTKANFSSDKGMAAPDEMHVQVYYTVKEHEGLYRVAVNNGLTLARLKEMNGLTTDEIATGKKLVIGHLQVKNTPEATARFTNTKGAFTPPIIVREEEVKKEDEKKDPPPPARDYAKPPEPGEEKRTTNDQVNKQPKAPVPPVEEVKNVAGLEEGLFKTDFQKMSSYGRSLKSATGTAAVFKTVSGWQDAKYYALMDGVEPGNIIQVTNPASGKTIYVKILGEMQELKQNHGLLLRLSNAAASALNAGTEKFEVTVKY